jgi:hypothetical protein
MQSLRYKTKPHKPQNFWMAHTKSTCKRFLRMQFLSGKQERWTYMCHPTHLADRHIRLDESLTLFSAMVDRMEAFIVVSPFYATSKVGPKLGNGQARPIEFHQHLADKCGPLLLSCALALYGPFMKNRHA